MSSPLSTGAMSIFTDPDFGLSGIVYRNSKLDAKTLFTVATVNVGAAVSESKVLTVKTVAVLAPPLLCNGVEK